MRSLIYLFKRCFGYNDGLSGTKLWLELEIQELHKVPTMESGDEYLMKRDLFFSNLDGSQQTRFQKLRELNNELEEIRIPTRSKKH